MSTASYAVTGMTCGYCIAEVMDHVRTLVGVTGVSVDLVQAGPSPVVVTSGPAVELASVREAVGEAGFNLTGVWTGHRAADDENVSDSRSGPDPFMRTRPAEEQSAQGRGPECGPWGRMSERSRT